MARKKHEHHGGSWKVAYADFVTAMMALFLCLWLTSQDQKIKDAVERAFRNPFSSVTKESVGIIPNKEASTTYKQQGKFSSISAIEMEAMHHLSEDLAKLFKDQEAGLTPVKIDVTTEGLSINVFDRSQKPIFNPGTDVFTDYGAGVFNPLASEIARRKIIEGGVDTAQICKVSGFADAAPADEANRRVTVLVKIKDSVNNLPEA